MFCAPTWRLLEVRFWMVRVPGVILGRFEERWVPWAWSRLSALFLMWRVKGFEGRKS